MASNITSKQGSISFMNLGCQDNILILSFLFLDEFSILGFRRLPTNADPSSSEIALCS